MFNTKSLLTALTLSFMGLLCNAQTVYFANLSDKMSIGLGYSAQSRFGAPSLVTLGIMQESKHKEYSDFTIKFINSDGDEFLKDLRLIVDTVYHFTDDGLKLHECDYTMTRFYLERIYREVGLRDIVIINGIEYNGSVFTGTLKGIEGEISKPFMGSDNFRNLNMWRWMIPQQRMNVELMRFNGPSGKKRDFRFIRKVEPANFNGSR